MKDLEKEKGIEFLNDGTEHVEILHWQIDEVKRRIDYYDKKPHELLSWDEVRKRLKT